MQSKYFAGQQTRMTLTGTIWLKTTMTKKMTTGQQSTTFWNLLVSQRKKFLKQNDLPEAEEDTEREAQDFLDDWELQKFLINDEKLREIKDESGSCKNSK